MSRRERDEFGDYVYEEEEYGSGLDVVSKILAKVTGETAKKLALKATEKAIEEGSKKIGSKMGDIAAEKLEDKFGKKSKKRTKQPEAKQDVKQLIETTKTKGDEIVKELQKLSNTKNTPKSSNTISSQFDEILDM